MDTTEILAQLAAEEQAELERRIRLGLSQEENTDGNNGGNNGNNGNNGGDPPPDAEPSLVDTHRVFPKDERNSDGTSPDTSKVGWIVWIYYQEPIPENRGLTFGTSGLTVRVYVNNERQEGINDDTSVLQTSGTDSQGNPDYSIQFFVSTRAYEGTDATSSVPY